MTLLGLIVALVIFGVVLWAIQQLPLDATVKRIIHVVAIVVLVIWLVSSFANIGSFNPRLW